MDSLIDMVTQTSPSVSKKGATSKCFVAFGVGVCKDHNESHSASLEQVSLATKFTLAASQLLHKSYTRLT